MSEITGSIVDEFRNGGWRLARTETAGAVSVVSKDNVTIDLSYRAGDVCLIDADWTIIVGPIGIAGAIELAEQILEGNTRASTDPKALLALATAVLGFSHLYTEPLDPAPLMNTAVASAPIAAIA